MSEEKARALKRLQELRNIGPVAAENLYSLGIESPEQLKNANPEELYELLKKKTRRKPGSLCPIPIPRRNQRCSLA